MNTSVTVGATATQVLTKNTMRGYAILMNDSDEIIYLALGEDASLNSSIFLNPRGGSLTIGEGQDNYWGSVSAICSSGNKRLTVMELNVRGPVQI